MERGGPFETNLESDWSDFFCYQLSQSRLLIVARDDMRCAAVLNKLFPKSVRSKAGIFFHKEKLLMPKTAVTAASMLTITSSSSSVSLKGTLQESHPAFIIKLKRALICCTLPKPAENTLDWSLAQWMGVTSDLDSQQDWHQLTTKVSFTGKLKDQHTCPKTFILNDTHH